MSDRATRVGFVSGHVHGMAALEGLLESYEVQVSAIELVCVVGYEGTSAHGSVGRASFAELMLEGDTEYVATKDGTLRDCVEKIADFELDYLLVVGWNRLIPKSVLDQAIPPTSGPNSGIIGMHPTQLPMGRGQAPIPWTILYGLSRTALSVFFLEEQADAGPLIDQLFLEVGSRCTSTDLFESFTALHRSAAHRIAPALAARLVSSQPQRGAVTTWVKRTPSDGAILLSDSFESIDRLIRALSPPYPPAFIDIDRRVFVSAVRRLSNAEPDFLPQETATKLIVCCSDAIIELDKQQGGAI